ALGARAALGIEHEHLLALAAEVTSRETGRDHAAGGGIHGARGAGRTLGALEDADDDGVGRDALDGFVAKLKLHGVEPPETGRPGAPREVASGRRQGRKSVDWARSKAGNRPQGASVNRIPSETA